MIAYPFRVSRETWAQVQAAAAIRKWSLATWLREAITEKLERDGNH